MQNKKNKQTLLAFSPANVPFFVRQRELYTIILTFYFNLAFPHTNIQLYMS